MRYWPVRIQPEEISFNKVLDIKFIPPEEKIAYTQSDANQKSIETNLDVVIPNDTISAEILSSEIASSNDELIDEEIEELLHQAKVKLIVNGQIAPKKLVNNEALLNAVENDLDKDFKQKVIEKIVNTIKKDKEVATSKENWLKIISHYEKNTPYHIYN